MPRSTMADVSDSPERHDDQPHSIGYLVGVDASPAVRWDAEVPGEGIDPCEFHAASAPVERGYDDSVLCLMCSCRDWADYKTTIRLVRRIEG